MSDTVPNAFLILLGQIGLFVVAFIYGLPLAIISGEINIKSIGFEEILFVLAISFASFMMVANIIIGWIAVCEAREEMPRYPKKMFVVDLLVIFTLFGMNNIIIYALGADFSAFDPSTVSKVVNSGITSEKTLFTIFLLMLMTAIYLFLCRIWNNEYFKFLEKSIPRYDLELSVVIVLITFFSIVALVSKNCPFASVISMLIWASCWIYINKGWIKISPE